MSPRLGAGVLTAELELDLKLRFKLESAELMVDGAIAEREVRTRRHRDIFGHSTPISVIPIP